ncbi:hypothetical protein SAMN06265222_101419 [Neorhodopirellula lusitana]|uniref:Uncharacterized protein n=1 Tax=Neorhodopirellula lusitana TaxID=445327 RepID=A0ABY1PRC0_9BACT|nr:hypothetical protein SAMN06265222_101419 [Neorhodopirellula lusitana]
MLAALGGRSVCSNLVLPGLPDYTVADSQAGRADIRFDPLSQADLEVDSVEIVGCFGE